MNKNYEKKYIAHDRNSTDRCNICGRVEKLTWDHVPPQAVLIAADTYASTMMGKYPTPQKYMRRYQNGIQYRTICQRCNNVLLGKYDGLYKEFIMQISEIFSHVGRGPLSTIRVTTKINRILRVICGHFLAMRSEYDENVTPEESMRAYLMDEKKKPEGFKIYSWLHPYETIVNVRDIVTPGFIEGTHPKDFISVMSAFPISFLLATANESECALDDLSSYATKEIDEEVEISLHISTAFYAGTNKLKDPLWPVDAGYNQFGAMGVFGGKEMEKGSRIGVPNVLRNGRR